MADTTDPSAPNQQGFKRFTSAFNGRLLYSCSLIALSQVNFGMDQGVFTGTQAMDPFTHRFGEYNAEDDAWALNPVYLSLLNSLTYIGFAWGLVTGSMISRRFGRRVCMFSMCIYAVVGATIMVTSQHKIQLLVGRVIAYIYIGMELAVVPVTQSELVPASVRGFVIGTYQSGLLTGQLIAALICRGTSTIATDRSWRIPLGLLYIIPVIVGSGVWFMPESPRWLLVRGRKEDAFVALQKLRQGRFSEERIKQEFEELQSTINLTVERGRMVEIFRGTNLKRTLIVVGVNIFLQLTGQNFTSVYGTIFIKDLGTVNPFTMQCANVAINISMTLLTQFLSDRVGRKPLMMAGACVQCAALMMMGGLGTVSNPSKAVMSGVTAVFIIFGAGFSLGWAPLSHVVAAEIPTNRLRDPTYAFGAIFNIIIQLAVSLSIPYLLYAPYANLGSKVGFIFGSTAFCCIIFTYFCIPECSGKTLEEIDELFIEGVPIRKFRHAQAHLPVAEAGDKGGVEKAMHVEEKSDVHGGA